MPRLTAEQWEQARADYEVRGKPFRDISKDYHVDIAAISRKAKNEGWKKAKCQHVVNKKVDAVRAFAEAESQKSTESTTIQREIDSYTDELLQQEGILASLSNAIARKAQGMLHNVEGIDDLEKLSRVKKNLTPPAAAQNTITVQQAAMSRADSSVEMSADEVCDQLIAEQEAERKRGRKQSPYFMRAENRTKKSSDRES